MRISSQSFKSADSSSAPQIVIQHTLNHTFLVAATTATTSDTNSINYYIYSLTLSHHAGRSCMHVLIISESTANANLTLTLIFYHWAHCLLL